MSKHTKGPWRQCGGHTPRYSAIVDGKGRYIVFQLADNVVDLEHGKPISAPDAEEQQANARLIAAAPDLLAFAQMCLADTYDRVSPGMKDIARAAIFKATGGGE